MKRVLSIQDISCFGKCSTTIALPVISAMGVETAILPTAVLSTHTMFKNFTVKDLSDQIAPITKHWKDEDIQFDSIYTGYLGSFEQIEMVEKIFADFAPDNKTLKFVDPVMADNGALYPAFDLDYAKRNAEFCGHADIIVPNITEACFMTDTPYKEDMSESEVKALLEKLGKLGPTIAVLTGVSLKDGMTGFMGLDTRTGAFLSHQNLHIDAAYHGTGDLFASACVGGIMNGLSWNDAMAIASDYTAETIAVTLKDPKKPWYGVNFETTLPSLIAKVEVAKNI
jgi:pyridoxine kinase